MTVICLANLKAKPDANHANAHPINDWSCQLCNQPCALSPARRTGFKSDTTRTNLPRLNVTDLRLTCPRIEQACNTERFLLARFPCFKYHGDDMPSSSYEQTLAALNPNCKQTIEVVFIKWSSDVILSLVSRNVADETALAHDDFCNLLTAFATHIASGVPDPESLKRACRTQKLKGRQIPTADCPAVLGRARSLEDHAKSSPKPHSAADTNGSEEATSKILGLTNPSASKASCAPPP